MVDTRDMSAISFPIRQPGRKGVYLLFPHPALNGFQFLFRHLLAIRKVAYD